MSKLGINIDHVATLRQARGVTYPDPVTAATIVEKAGADQVTIHLREDRRHIVDADVRMIKKVVSTSLNLEMAASEDILKVALEVHPDTCTFVPENRKELTTEGGLDVASNFKTLRPFVHALKEAGVIVSMFIDPETEQVEASKELGVSTIEIHTGRYCEFAHGIKMKEISSLSEQAKEELERIKKSAKKGSEVGLYVAAGHGLNYDNIGPIVKEIPEVIEYNIGHSIIARALFVGLEQAVKEMKQLTMGAKSL